MASDNVGTKPLIEKGCIETFSGICWNCVHPRAEDVRLDDVARGLALMCRFGGQIQTHYSVGQHSLNVYRFLYELWPTDYHLQLHGLLHDGSEAYLSDLVRPLKHLIPEYLAIEARTQAAVLEGLGCTIPLTPYGEKLLKTADNAVLLAERRALKPNSKFDWRIDAPKITWPIVPITDWTIVEELFKCAYLDLIKRI